MLSLLKVFFLLFIVTTAQTTTYRAAVYEHEAPYPNTATSKNEAISILNNTLNIIEANIISAATNNVDILVLGEMSLTGLIFNREEMYYFLEIIPEANLGMNSTACNNNQFIDRPILTRISCMTQINNIYLSINWGDIVPCNKQNDPNCPNDNHYQYNTEIVFNNNGEIIAKYYKIHTYEATEFDSPPIKNPNYVTFNLNIPNKNINIDIGLFICWDAIYQTPVIPLINNKKINNFIISSWWNNQYAYFEAVSWWRSLSYRYKVNLLGTAAWWSYMSPWSSGSGIFSAGHILKSWYNTEHKSLEKVLIADIPIIPIGGGPANDLPVVEPYIEIKQKPIEECGNSKYWSSQYLSKNINKLITDSVECNGFTCNVQFIVTNSGTSNDYWFLLVNDGYGGIPDGNNVYMYEQFCSFYKCNDQHGCWTETTQLYDDTATTVFESISLYAKFMNNSVQFVLSSGKDGDVYQNITEKLTTTTTNNGIFNATYKKLQDIVINLSILSRPYYMDAHYT